MRLFGNRRRVPEGHIWRILLWSLCCFFEFKLDKSLCFLALLTHLISDFFWYKRTFLPRLETLSVLVLDKGSSSSSKSIPLVDSGDVRTTGSSFLSDSSFFLGAGGLGWINTSCGSWLLLWPFWLSCVPLVIGSGVEARESVWKLCLLWLKLN